MTKTLVRVRNFIDGEFVEPIGGKYLDNVEPATGIQLTESYAMMPAAAVSGLYFAHPEARYFTVGRVGDDQIAAYARRKGQSIEQVERWLTSYLAYEPTQV